MRDRASLLRSLMIVCLSALAVTGCSDDDPLVPPGTGGADIDVVNSTPATGDTNISGNGVSVDTIAETLMGTPVLRVQVDATTGGQLRRVQVIFESANGTLRAVNYMWGATNLLDNVVHCPQAGCVGVTVNMSNQEIFFDDTILDDSGVGIPATKFATLELGAIQYPDP
jgi:hypothetical protein